MHFAPTHSSKVKAIVILLMSLFLSNSDVYGQDLNSDRYFYMQIGGGLSFQHTDINNTKFAPYAVAATFGYRLIPALSLQLSYQIANYPDLRPSLEVAFINSVGLTAKYSILSKLRFSPYLLLGGHMSFAGSIGADEKAYGPTGGLGFEFAFTQSLSVFLEGRANYSIPDTTLDDTAGDLGFDLIGYAGGGIRFALGTPKTSPQILSIQTPVNINPGEPFDVLAALSNKTASPYRIIWDFGDGTQAETSFSSTSHAYNFPGTYIIKATVRNRLGRETIEKAITVLAPDPCPTAPVIGQIESTKSVAETGEPVTFSANVTGSQPLFYEWKVNGTSVAQTESFSYTFNQPGSYSVSFEATNCRSNDRRTIAITVLKGRTQIITQNPCVSRPLNEISFSPASQNISRTMRAKLVNNVSSLNRCSQNCIQVIAYVGADDEELLAKQRLNDVVELYIELGLAPERINTQVIITTRRRLINTVTTTASETCD